MDIYDIDGLHEWLKTLLEHYLPNVPIIVDADQIVSPMVIIQPGQNDYTTMTLRSGANFVEQQYTLTVVGRDRVDARTIGSVVVKAFRRDRYGKLLWQPLSGWHIGQTVIQLADTTNDPVPQQQYALTINAQYSHHGS